VENLEQVRDRLARSLTDAQLHIVRRYMDAGSAAIAIHGDALPETIGGSLEPDVRLYVQAAVDGQRQAALNIALEAIRRGVPVPDVYCDLLQEAQYEIGRLWERNVISVAREHMATAITQFVVAQLYSHLEFRHPPRGRIIISGVEGELHQLGANMLADVLEADGWNVRFLGTQMPHRDILRAIEEHEATVLGVSITMLYNLPKVARLVTEARAVRGPELQIVVGGGAFNASNEAWRDIGADATARDLREAVAVVGRLVQST
jgi:MerR family transcriptional regulator, light-induced transcriptional regulator